MKRRLVVPRWLAVTMVGLAGILALSLTLLSHRAGQTERLEAITIGVPPLEQNALLYVAEARRLFDSNGLQVTIQDYDTGVAAVNALLAGKVDIAGLAEFPFIKPVLENQPLRIMAVNDRFENDYLLVRKNRGITTAADLKGKKIGVIRGTILEFYLGRFLKLQGIDLADVTIVDTLNPTQTVDAIVNGELDAVVAFQPHVQTIQERLSSGVMTWPVQSDQLVYGILVSKADWITQNSETVNRFLKSLAEAEKYLVAHPDKARAIVKDRLSLDEAYVSGVWPLHEFSLALDFSLIIALNDEARWMINNHLVAAETVPDFKQYIYFDGLETIKPEAVSINR